MTIQLLVDDTCMRHGLTSGVLGVHVIAYGVTYNWGGGSRFIHYVC